jgi:hypothetical protein
MRDGQGWNGDRCVTGGGRYGDGDGREGLRIGKITLCLSITL